MIKINNTIKKFRLLQITSSNLPIGSFIYSKGLEWAVESGWIANIENFRLWQQQQIDYTLTRLDWPILKRLYISYKLDDIDSFQFWIQLLLANRETSELRDEEKQRGAALFKLFHIWDLPVPNSDWSSLIKKSQISGLAWLGNQWKIPLFDLAISFGYSWLENAIITGIKLVPFGQSTAQILLKDLSQSLAYSLPKALSMTDNDLGSGLPLVAIASSCHETQFTRLFRS
ncbi:urease accessory protein UreF [Candidatus Schneideria nysicola]|uniref:urease accessory protein UreF n=1 Tax=Candidatus Schneideria nysicola TaxID=1081631 RepID=UPI001FE5C81E|nr:urease accessory UreF family protein [Candidatus Schneideria nysicola]